VSWDSEALRIPATAYAQTLAASFMEIAIVLGLIYLTTLVLNFVKKDWPTTLKKVLVLGHIVFALLTVIQVILLTTKELTFRGVYFDRIIFWGLFISGGLFFALFKGKTVLARIYFGTYLFYPIIAATTFLIDRIMFVLFASPFLVSLIIPETYYKDDKFEIRSNSGLMAPRQIILIEKDLLTEKEVGRTEYGDGEINGIQILSTTTDSINAKLDYGHRTELVRFKTSR
jgi:hypothetical protein